MIRRIFGALFSSLLATVLVSCSVTPPIPTVREPIVPISTWREVFNDIAVHTQDAQYAANRYALDATEHWMAQVRERTEQEYIPWYTSFWTQQWLAVRVGWYEANTADDDAAAPLARHLQQEYYERVLEPIAETRDPRRIMQQAARRYVAYLKSALAAIQSQYGLPPNAFARHLQQIPAIAVSDGRAATVSLYELFKTSDVTRLPAYVALSSSLAPGDARYGDGLTGNRFYAISKHSADELVDDLALRGGGSATALAVGGLPGMLISVAVTGWQAQQHEQDRPALEANLRANLNELLDRMWQQMAEDPRHGVTGPVNHMTAQILSGTTGPPGRMRRGTSRRPVSERQ